MAQLIENAVADVVTTVAGVTGILQVPVNPPDTINVATFALVYAANGTIDNGVIGAKKSLHNIHVLVLTKRTDQARDMARVKPFIDLIPSALLADPTLGGTVQTFDGIDYDLYPNDDYAGVPVFGYVFTIKNAKILWP
jgi:hypothetical protein